MSIALKKIISAEPVERIFQTCYVDGYDSFDVMLIPHGCIWEVETCHHCIEFNDLLLSRIEA